ncbi:MAG: hypothetical protein H7175_10365, partial [Burkholderiales bacterium]|nr:hypothetical protein [Anaerolineae bacterium]
PHTADETIKSGKVAVRTLKTKAGNIIRFTDEAGKEKIEIIDAKQGTTITLDGTQKSLTITCEGDMTLSAEKGNFTVKAKAVKVESTSTLDLKATGPASLESSATVKVKGTMVNIN